MYDSESTSVNPWSGMIGGFSMLQRMAAWHFLEERHVPKGEWLWHEGDTAEFMAVIESGSVCLVKGHSEKRNGLVLEKCSHGAIVGEDCYGSRQTRSTSVKAIDDTRLFVLRQTDFFQMAQQEPLLASAFALCLMRLQADRYSHLVKRHATAQIPL